MAKVSNVMATKVALDMVEASTSIRNLTTIVNSATQAWKAQEANMRSAGDYAGAAKAKYEGLGNAISAQRDKIEALERKQSEMNNIDKEAADQYLNLRSKLNQYREELERLDTTTNEGKERYQQLNSAIEKTKSQLDKLDTGTIKSAEQFLKYGQQVDRAKAKLASLESQRQRAAQQVDLENSGIIRLNATMQAQSALATATAERLRSQGQNYQAMVVEVNNLRSRLDSLREIQTRESQLLETTRTRMGETSEAYIKQATRVEELGTKIQETRSKLNEMNETMRRIPSGWLGNVSSRLDSIQGKADRVSASFGRIFGATAAANLFTNALGSIGARLSDLTKAGIDYNVEQNKMIATWSTLTGSASKAQPLVDSINKMSQATGQDVDVVNELEQGFYHLNSSKKQADGMTSSLLNMADAVGLNGDQIKAVEQDMVHGMATGKITQGELNQIGMYFPMIDEAMAKHFNTTVAGMRQMATAGKITSKDLQEVFEKLGNGKYKEAADNMMNSYFGVFRTIRARTPQLIGDVTKPFMSISNPFLQSVRSWVNDKSTDDEFQRLGNQMARSMNQIISAFGGSNISATKLMDNAIRGLTNGVREFGDIVSSHHTEIANFFSAFKEGSTAQAKIFANVFLDLSKVMLPVLNLMAKFPKTSAALVTSFILASRAVKTLQAGINGFQSLKIASEALINFSNKLRGIPSKKTTKLDVNTIDAEHRLATTQRSIKALPNSKSTRLEIQNTNADTKLATTKRNIQQVPNRKLIAVQANTVNAQQNVSRVKTLINGVPRRVEIIGRANTAQAVTSISRVGTISRVAATTARTSFSLIGTSAKLASTGLDLIGGPAGAIMLVIQGFQLLYTHSAKFRKFVNGIVSSAKSMASRVGRWAGNMASSFGRHVNRMVSSARRSWNNINRQTQRSVQQEQRSHQRMEQNTERSSQRMWAQLTRRWQQGWNHNNQVTRQGVQRQLQEHQSLSTRMANFNTQMWNRISNITGNGSNRIEKQWGNHRSNLGNIGQGISRNSQNILSDMHDKLSGLTDSGLGKMLSSWKDHFTNVIGVINNAQSPVHKVFMGVLKGIASPFETIINAIAKGINWITDKVGGDLHIGTGFIIDGFANGTPNGGILHDQIALLNDGNGPHFQEMIHKKNSGQTFMLPPKRNVVLPLEKGDEVLDGENSYQLANALSMPIPHANGAIGNFFSGIWDNVSDAASEAMDWGEKALKNVVEFGTETFNHFISIASGPKDNGHYFSEQLHYHTPNYVARSIQKWIKKQLEAMNADAQGYVDKAKFSLIAKHAAALMHQTISDGDIDRLYWQGHVESGDGANMGAGVDDHDGTGRPLGFYQYKLRTWNSWSVPGHKNIMSILDQTMAVLNDSNWRSDLAPIGVTRGWGPSGHKMFANGGIATSPSIFGEAGAEMAIPLDTMKSTRAWQLMRQVVDYYAGSSNNVTQVNNQTDLTPIEERLDATLAQNQQLINLIDKLIGVTDSANNPTARYRRTQRDINMAQAQSLGGY